MSGFSEVEMNKPMQKMNEAVGSEDAMTIAMGTAVPAENKLEINLSETIVIEGKTFFYKDPNCTDNIWLCFCPWTPLIEYTSKDMEVLKYKNNCVCCCLPWEAHVGPTKVGFTSAPKACDNGCMFCLCPWCTCMGEIVMQARKRVSARDGPHRAP